VCSIIQDDSLIGLFDRERICIFHLSADKDESSEEFLHRKETGQKPIQR
jgi:hypothetical protein